MRVFLDMKTHILSGKEGGKKVTILDALTQN